MDEDMREDLAGTTAVCVVIKDQKLYCVRPKRHGAMLDAREDARLLSRAMLAIVERSDRSTGTWKFSPSIINPTTTKNENESQRPAAG